MPALSDLFNITPGAISTAPQRMRNLPPSPIKPEWDIRSGLPEPGLEQVTPEEWLPPGAGVKLAALAKGGMAPLAAGIIKNRGGAWDKSNIPFSAGLPIRQARSVPESTIKMIQDRATPEQIAEMKAYHDSLPDDLWKRYTSHLYTAANRHIDDPSYLPFLQKDPASAIERWRRGPLANYITRDMATEGDPIRALAEQGITHLPESMTKSLPRVGPDLSALRERQGFPAREIASTKLGKIWERMADSRVSPGKKNEYGDPTYSYKDSTSYPKGDPDFYGLVDKISGGIRKGEIDPASVSRGNFTVESAVRYADKIRRDLALGKTAPDVFKEYPETGHKWVQLNKPGQFAAEADAMAHSVRGYEPPELGLGGYDGYGAGGFRAIESGEAKIFSLRTPTGKPAVTVEVVRDPDGAYRISQIRGKANSRPKPEYSQMIEDLISSGKFRQGFDE